MDSGVCMPDAAGRDVPHALAAWMQPFRAAFTAPTWRHVLLLVMGGIQSRLRMGPFNLRPGGRELPIFGQRHGMIGKELKIVAVVWSEGVHHRRDLMLLPEWPDAPITPLGFAPLASTRASRGQAERCTCKAAIAASVRPANTRSKNVI